jgi:hypothetical protein
MKQTEFTLREVLVLGGGGLKVTYISPSQIKKGGEHLIETTIKSSIACHADMDEALDKYALVVARIFGFLHTDLLKAYDAMNSQEQERYDHVMERIKIIGIKLSGDDETRSVQITFQRTIVTGQKVTVTSPALRISEDSFFIDGEDKMDAYTAVIVDEVFKYCFKAKHGQLDLFPEDA